MGFFGNSIMAAIGCVAGWAAFIFLWYRALQYVTPEEIVFNLTGLLLTILVVLVVSIFWVSYNISIFRRKGPRKGLPNATLTLDRDFLGQKYQAPDLQELQAAHMVRVRVDGARGIKQLVPEGEAPAASPAPGK